MASVEYREYIASPEWWARRTAAVARAGGRCQMCYSPDRLQVHHRTYERLGNELPSDLTVLCAPCHEKHHGIGAKGKPAAKSRAKKVPKSGALSMACPSCSSAAGKPCRSPAGKVTKAHKMRRKEAEKPKVVATRPSPPKAFAVECPACFAAVGKPCKLKNRIHWDRTELALART